MIQIIGAACSSGGQHIGCRFGPEHFHEHSFRLMDLESIPPVLWYKTIDENNGKQKESVYTDVSDYCLALKQAVMDVIQMEEIPLVIGGDHSCAIGTWSGVSQSINKPIGMLWIDAHLDSHTPDTSDSGAIHGMPLACLLGEGEHHLLSVSNYAQVIDPAHTCIVGVRSYENEEIAFLKNKGVKVFDMGAIRAKGLNNIFTEAQNICVGCSNGFGISIDLDAMDPNQVPGVSVPESGGLNVLELFDALKAFNFEGRLRGIEIAEYNPVFDSDSKTDAIIGDLIKSICH